MSPPAHCTRHRFAVQEGCLAVGGVAVDALATRVGGTPFYAYERSALTARVAHLRRHLPAGVALHYAIKANPMPALVCHMARIVDGLDVASGGELNVALDTGICPGEVSFAGPGKRTAELQQAVAARVLVNVESEAEVVRLGEIAHTLGLPARVAVRVNPDFALKGAGMRMGGGPRPFGVDMERVPALLQDIHARGLQFEGFHFYSGSQSLSAQAIAQAQAESLTAALALAAHAPAPPRSINIGGGFGIPYFEGDAALDLAPIGLGLCQLQRTLMLRYPQCRLTLELGRYLVGEAGVYVCRVVDRKISRGQVYLVTDGGLHHHLAASGNFGQVLRRNFPVAVANKMSAPAQETVNVVGPLCTPLDVLADQVALPRAEPGDFIAVFQSGAYGRSASPAAFLGHPNAIEVLV